MGKLFLNLSWRQIIIYLIATLLISTGLKQLAFLTDIELAETLYIKGLENLPAVADVSERSTYLLLWIKGSELLGLLISGIIITRITMRTESSWINTLIILIIGFAIISSGLLDGHLIKEITTFIGRQFLDLGLSLVYLINGLLATALGLLILFSKWTRLLTVNST